jgi:ubiquinone/menaquinone biosynthesis C-methylase UbiE
MTILPTPYALCPVIMRPMTDPKTSRIPLNEHQFTGGQTAAFYDEHARRFMGPVFRAFAKEASRLKPAGNRVLDIGTGGGLLAMEISRLRPDWHITGVDISADMVNYARGSIDQAGLTDKIDLVQASAAELPFSDSGYDIVVSNASLHLWQNPVTIFNEIARVTAPGGYFMLWDNLRAPVFYPLFNIAGRFMGMNKDQRTLWLKAIRSSYTVGETKKLLEGSALKNAHVRIDLLLLELCITWKKP